MDLLKQISEDINNYQQFFTRIVKKIAVFEQEISQENRLGLMETPYYTQDKAQHIPGEVTRADTVDFKASDEPVAAPVQHPNAARAPQRIHLIYDPAQGKVVNVVKTDTRSRPPADFVEASQQQIADAMKHIQNLSPETAQKIKAGLINIWIPRSQHKPVGTDRLQSTGTGPGMNTMNINPSQLSAARQAADKMSFS
jgi:hypothetical protein